MHGVKEGADRTLKDKLSASCGGNKHFQGIGSGFAIHHYAGRKQACIQKVKMSFCRIVVGCFRI